MRRSYDLFDVGVSKGSLILGSGLLSRCCKAVWRPIVTCLSQLRRMLLTRDVEMPTISRIGPVGSIPTGQSY
eukprot:COSAG01_NODE_5201_length_4414_cov_468.710313_1_plen_72_part_00